MCPQPCFEGTAVGRGTTEDEHRGLRPWVSAPLSGLQRTRSMLRLGNKAMALPSAPGTPAPASCMETSSLGRHISEFRLPPYGPGFHPFLNAMLKRQLASTILTVKRGNVKEKASIGTQVQTIPHFYSLTAFSSQKVLVASGRPKGNVSRVCCLTFVICYSVKAQIHPPRKQQKHYRWMHAVCRLWGVPEALEKSSQAQNYLDRSSIPAIKQILLNNPITRNEEQVLDKQVRSYAYCASRKKD